MGVPGPARRAGSDGGPRGRAGLSELGREQARRLGQRLRQDSFAAIHYRTPVPAPGQRSQYPERYWYWLDGVPEQERDEGGGAIQHAIEHLGRPGTEDRRELVITHNFVIGWLVRHALDAPVWRWMGLNQANCGLTIVQWDGDGPPSLISFNDVGHLG